MPTPKKLKLRWRKDPAETGLRAVGNVTRSSTLRLDGAIKCASVDASLHRYSVVGWYWVAGWGCGIPTVNTCREPVATEQEAKDAALAYVTLHLNKIKNETT